jgi:hypothetical protein
MLTPKLKRRWMGYDPLYTSGSIPSTSVDVSKFKPFAKIRRDDIFTLSSVFAGSV